MDGSRKRGHDDSEGEPSKRVAVYGDGGPGRSKREGEDGDVLFKLLCPPTAVGAIIGKAGVVLNQLKDITGCRIRVSQNTEFYPGD